jgi:hypothetical protein
MAKRNREEDALQNAVVIWLQTQENLGRLTYHAIMNNPRSARDGARLKQMGLRAGTPDLLIISPWRVPLYVELKAPKGRVSFEQVESMHRLETVGGAMCVVCRSQEDVQKIVTGWLQTKMEKAA